MAFYYHTSPVNIKYFGGDLLSNSLIFYGVVTFFFCSVVMQHFWAFKTHLEFVCLCGWIVNYIITPLYEVCLGNNPTFWIRGLLRFFSYSGNWNQLFWDQDCFMKWKRCYDKCVSRGCWIIKKLQKYSSVIF